MSVDPTLVEHEQISVPSEGLRLPDDMNTPPEVRLSEMGYQRDGLLRSAADNRNAAMARQHELQTLIAAGQIDPDYDVENDHRYVSLLQGAQHWERQAAEVSERIEQAREAWGRLAAPLQGPVKSRVRRTST